MVVGLGTGSTAAFFLTALAERLSNERLRIAGIPTSEHTAALARQLEIPLTTFTEHWRIDLTVDGADEVELGTLSLIKGHGGALLREKIVAAASDRMVVVVDETKVSEKLGTLSSVPVEIVQFGWQLTLKKTRRAGWKSGAKARPGRQASAHGRRELHRRLRFRTDGQSKGDGASPRSCYRRSRTRPVPQICTGSDRGRTRRGKNPEKIG